MKYIFSFLCFIFSFSSAQVFTKLSGTNGEARDKSYDVLHYKIELSFDESKKMVIGKTTITFVPYLTKFRTVEFDAENMNFTSVSMKKKSLRFDSLAATIRITLDKEYSYNDTLTVTIRYHCVPKKGVYFIQPDSGYPNKPWQIWTQGEDMDNHLWFPCWDFPNDRATSEIIATVKSNYVFLSNGKLVSEKENKKNGTKTFHWKQTIPHVSYLVMFAAGEYAILKEKVDGVPLEYYVYKHHIDDAKACYAQTGAIMKFFNAKIGFRYPWDKYAQVIVADFTYGGMENTSATTLMDRITVFNARARVDESAESLIAHELAHQWWGDVVTCKDWRHKWLNESFASYFDPLYFEHAYGKDEFLNIMQQSQQAGINTDKSLGRKPIVSVDSYSNNIYPRGASVLNMLRFVLGDELFWKAINHYITKYQFQTVETDDFKNAIEESTGQNLYWFFDQWVYKAGYPKFDVSYVYNESSKSLFLTVKQTQTMDSLTGVFKTPVDVEIVTSTGNKTHRINIVQKESTYTLAANGKPNLVLFDKDNWILKEVTYSNRKTSEWKYQAEFGNDVVARKTALVELAQRDTSGEYISLIAKISSSDKFWGVRQSAVDALGTINTISEIKKNALIAALHDKKSKVRASAATQLGKIKSPDVAAVLRAALNDSSYSTEANALSSLAKIDSLNAIPFIKERLNKWSYKNQVIHAALNSLENLDPVEGVTAALHKVQYGSEPLGRSIAMNILKNHGKNRDDVKAMCISLLNDTSGPIQFNAVELLGEAGTESHLAALEILANKKNNSASEAAKKAIGRIKERSKK
ncbi:MAG: M1 family aminopeptidase [Bacteroidota bacterium]|nr:M1 family aminopeptidase [Bacteroidota bacterium]